MQPTGRRSPMSVELKQLPNSEVPAHEQRGQLGAVERPQHTPQSQILAGLQSEQDPELRKRLFFMNAQMHAGTDVIKKLACQVTDSSIAVGDIVSAVNRLTGLGFDIDTIRNHLTEAKGIHQKIADLAIAHAQKDISMISKLDKDRCQVFVSECKRLYINVVSIVEYASVLEFTKSELLEALDNCFPSFSPPTSQLGHVQAALNLYYPPEVGVHDSLNTQIA